MLQYLTPAASEEAAGSAWKRVENRGKPGYRLPKTKEA
jgi:hypothetical protein